MFGDVRVIYGIKIFDMDIGELKEKIEKFISYLDNLYFPKDEEELVISKKDTFCLLRDRSHKRWKN